MMDFRWPTSPLAGTGAALAAGLLCGGLLVSELQAAGYIVSQKGRAFLPASLVVAPGAVVTIVNDDADLLHHVYVDSAGFSFDSGDQEPGSRTPITFTKSGTFMVLCAIHPKMKLTIRVN